MSSPQYSLIDFGNGRKLERFGEHVLDRPCPAAAEIAKRNVTAWMSATARFAETSEMAGKWHRQSTEVSETGGPSWPQVRNERAAKPAWSDSWEITLNGLTFELKPTNAGQVGVFPEQAGNWEWIERQVTRIERSPKILNLFAYTGGSTMAAAAAGAEVVHVDAARNVVEWARRNASRAGLADRPIRWIVDDCRKFVRRELRRGQRYDAIILDPPSYGHGPNAESWQLSKHLLPLLRDCAELVNASPLFVLLTCHSPGFGPPELSAYLQDAFIGHCGSRVWSDSLVITSESGGRLHAGTVARWPM